MYGSTETQTNQDQNIYLVTSFAKSLKYTKPNKERMRT